MLLRLSAFARKKIYLAILFLFSGASLLVFIYLKLNLGLVLLAFFGISYFLFKKTTALLPATQQHQINTAIKNGASFGVLGTLFYDLTRYLIVAIFQMKFNPFMSFYHFGNAIIGHSGNQNLALLIGALYHLLNGVAFATAYVIVFRGRHWLWGIAWALVLEAFIFSIYPGWLNLAAVMAEFTVVSLIGHVAYGLTIGLLNQRKTARHSD